ncbi:unnamed protein product [Amoebophrya sp. A25]|nr:unnamed protein product [Amoebophrya sp. A25]|eukprot:GSA25T00002708001.1
MAERDILSFGLGTQKTPDDLANYTRKLKKSEKLSAEDLLDEQNFIGQTFDMKRQIVACMRHGTTEVEDKVQNIGDDDDEVQGSESDDDASEDEQMECDDGEGEAGESNGGDSYDEAEVHHNKNAGNYESATADKVEKAARSGSKDKTQKAGTSPDDGEEDQEKMDEDGTSEDDVLIDNNEMSWDSEDETSSDDLVASHDISEDDASSEEMGEEDDDIWDFEPRGLQDAGPIDDPDLGLAVGHMWEDGQPVRFVADEEIVDRSDIGNLTGKAEGSSDEDEEDEPLGYDLMEGSKYYIPPATKEIPLSTWRKLAISGTSRELFHEVDLLNLGLKQNQVTSTKGARRHDQHEDDSQEEDWQCAEFLEGIFVKCPLASRKTRSRENKSEPLAWKGMKKNDQHVKGEMGSFSTGSGPCASTALTASSSSSSIKHETLSVKQEPTTLFVKKEASSDKLFNGETSSAPPANNTSSTCRSSSSSSCRSSIRPVFPSAEDEWDDAECTQGQGFDKFMLAAYQRFESTRKRGHHGFKKEVLSDSEDDSEDDLAQALFQQTASSVLMSSAGYTSLSENDQQGLSRPIMMKTQAEDEVDSKPTPTEERCEATALAQEREQDTEVSSAPGLAACSDASATARQRLGLGSVDERNLRTIITQFVSDQTDKCCAWHRDTRNVHTPARSCCLSNSFISGTDYSRAVELTGRKEYPGCFGLLPLHNTRMLKAFVEAQLVEGIGCMLLGLEPENEMQDTLLRVRQKLLVDGYLYPENLKPISRDERSAVSEDMREDSSRGKRRAAHEDEIEAPRDGSQALSQKIARFQPDVNDPAILRKASALLLRKKAGHASASLLSSESDGSLCSGEDGLSSSDDGHDFESPDPRDALPSVPAGVDSDSSASDSDDSDMSFSEDSDEEIAESGCQGVSFNERLEERDDEHEVDDEKDDLRNADDEENGEDANQTEEVNPMMEGSSEEGHWHVTYMLKKRTMNEYFFFGDYEEDAQLQNDGRLSEQDAREAARMDAVAFRKALDHMPGIVCEEASSGVENISWNNTKRRWAVGSVPDEAESKNETVNEYVILSEYGDEIQVALDAAIELTEADLQEEEQALAEENAMDYDSDDDESDSADEDMDPYERQLHELAAQNCRSIDIAQAVMLPKVSRFDETIEKALKKGGSATMTAAASK